MTAAMTIVLSVTVVANLLFAKSATNVNSQPSNSEPADHPTGIEFYV
jgi:hypothetical protein